MGEQKKPEGSSRSGTNSRGSLIMALAYLPHLLPQLLICVHWIIKSKAFFQKQDKAHASKNQMGTALNKQFFPVRHHKNTRKWWENKDEYQFLNLIWLFSVYKAFCDLISLSLGNRNSLEMKNHRVETPCDSRPLWIWCTPKNVTTITH